MDDIVLGEVLEPALRKDAAEATSQVIVAVNHPDLVGLSPHQQVVRLASPPFKFGVRAIARALKLKRTTCRSWIMKTPDIKLGRQAVVHYSRLLSKTTFLKRSDMLRLVRSPWVR